MCYASLTQYYLEMKYGDFGLVVLLWSYDVIVFPCPKFVKAYNRLLFNLTVPSVPQGRQIMWKEWTTVNNP